MPGSVAARSMAWRRRMGSLAGPVGPTGEMSDGNPVLVELLISGVWTDITSYVMTRDGGEHISITRGKRDEGSQTEHSTCQFQLNNRDGRFSPRNPTSPYYGVLGRNQQLRISVPGPNGTKLYRFWGEISAWPTKWDLTGTDIWVEVEAAGIIRRLSQGAVPLRSVIYNAITDPEISSLVAYWPCEDAAGSENISTPLVNGSPMTFSGVPELAACNRFGASDPLPTLTGASLTGGIAKYDMTSVTQYQVRFLLYVPPEGLNDLDCIFRVHISPEAVGEPEYLDILYNNPSGLGSFGPAGSLTIDVLNGDESPLGVSGTQYLTGDIRGKLMRVSLEVANNGTSLSITLRTLNVVTSAAESTTIGVTNNNVTRVLTVAAGPVTLAQSVGIDYTAVGHITVQTTVTSIDDLGGALEPTGEVAGRRVERLCNEESIPFDGIGDLDATVALGGQPRQKPLDVMRDAELADGGMLYETLSVFGLGYRTRVSMQNQAPALTLSYPGNELSEVPEPVDDDQLVRNKVTVTREGEGGQSAVAELTTGNMSTSPPPVGIGVYGEDFTLNLADDSTVEDQAYWRMQLSTVDEARFPQISVNLARSQFVDNPSLKWAALAVRPGDRLVVTDPPDWLPPDDISQLAFGISETIDHFEHKITYMCAPESPWRTGVLEDSVNSRIDTDGSAVYADATSGATSLYVTPTGIGGLWTTDSADFPFDVRTGGEIMTVTSIASAGSDDFTRSVSNDWGTSSGGGVWSQAGGAASERNVNGAQGVITWAADPTTIRFQTLVSGLTDAEVKVTMSASQVATGASFIPAILFRWTGVNDYYRARLHLSTGGSTFLSVSRGTTQVGSTVTLPYTYIAADQFYVRAKLTGHQIQLKAWPVAEAEPLSWQCTETISSGTIASGAVGVSGSAFGGNTNVSPQLIYDDYSIRDPQVFTVTRSVNGVTKAQTQGTDLRLAYPTIISM